MLKYQQTLWSEFHSTMIIRYLQIQLSHQEVKNHINNENFVNFIRKTVKYVILIIEKNINWLTVLIRLSLSSSSMQCSDSLSEETTSKSAFTLKNIKKSITSIRATSRLMMKRMTLTKNTKITFEITEESLTFMKIWCLV